MDELLRKSAQADASCEVRYEIPRSNRATFGIPIPKSSTDSIMKSYGRESSEVSSCSNEECCSYPRKGPEENTSISKDKSSKRASSFPSSKSRDRSYIRQRREARSPSTESQDSSLGKIVDKNKKKHEYLENIHSRQSKKFPTLRTSEKYKSSYRRRSSRRKHEPSVSPIRSSNERSRTSINQNKTNDRIQFQRRPTTPSSPDKLKKSVEKVPYFADVVRERDRLRRKYKSPPAVVDSRHPSLKSRSIRHYRSRSRPHSYSRSRSRSGTRHRKSELGHHRYKRDGSPYQSWPAAPQIITFPVPVPDYSFAFPPYHSQPGWTHLPARPPRFPYFPHHHYRSHRQVPFNAPAPPIRFMPSYGFNGIPDLNNISAIKPHGRELYRYPYT